MNPSRMRKRRTCTTKPIVSTKPQEYLFKIDHQGQELFGDPTWALFALQLVSTLGAEVREIFSLIHLYANETTTRTDLKRGVSNNDGTLRCQQFKRLATCCINNPNTRRLAVMYHPRPLDGTIQSGVFTARRLGGLVRLLPTRKVFNAIGGQIADQRVVLVALLLLGTGISRCPCKRHPKVAGGHS